MREEFSLVNTKTRRVESSHRGEFQVRPKQPSGERDREAKIAPQAFNSSSRLEKRIFWAKSHRGIRQELKPENRNTGILPEQRNPRKTWRSMENTGGLGPRELICLGSRGGEEEDRGTGAVENRGETGAGGARRTNAGSDMRGKWHKRKNKQKVR